MVSVSRAILKVARRKLGRISQVSVMPDAISRSTASSRLPKEGEYDEKSSGTYHTAAQDARYWFGKLRLMIEIATPYQWNFDDGSRQADVIPRADQTQGGRTRIVWLRKREDGGFV